MRRRNNSAPLIELEVTLKLPRHATPLSTEGVRPPARERTPRVTRLMALAVKYQGLVDSGEFRDYADIARLGYVSRARVTQIMNLSNLAPDIQEQLLFPEGSLPPERRVRHVTALVEWAEQRRSWCELVVGL
ncbi:MAG: hypothetical protein IT167_15815 [Bryobacterales bacterium]|nr:hypothetical protein [Bryobacterales bacterium]